MHLCIFIPFCINPDLSGITSKAFGGKHSTLISTKAADAKLEEKSNVHNLRKKSGRDNLWDNLGQSCFGKSQPCTISVVALALFVAHAQAMLDSVKSSRACKTLGKSQQGLISMWHLLGVWQNLKRLEKKCGRHNPCCGTISAPLWYLLYLW